MTKKEIAAALESRGVTVRAGQTKRELQALLEGLDALKQDHGIEPVEPSLMDILAEDNETADAAPGAVLPEPHPVPISEPVPEPHPDTDLTPAPAPAPMSRYVITIGSTEQRGVTCEPEAVRAEIADIKGASVQFWPAARPGDRVCMSWHGSRQGTCMSVAEDMAEIQIDGVKGTARYPLADCCVASA